MDWIPLNLGKENGMEVFLLNVWEDPMFLEDPLLLNLKEYPLLLKKQKMKVKIQRTTKQIKGLEKQEDSDKEEHS